MVTTWDENTARTSHLFFLQSKAWASAGYDYVLGWKMNRLQQEPSACWWGPKPMRRSNHLTRMANFATGRALKALSIYRLYSLAG